MTDPARLSLQLTAAQLQVAAAREIIVSLLTQSDPPEEREVRELAREWLRDNAASHSETLNALGALLRGQL